MKGENDIVDCMDALAEMVQPIFRDTRNKWSVEEELTYIKNYCKIMNYRYGEKNSAWYRSRQFTYVCYGAEIYFAAACGESFFMVWQKKKCGNIRNSRYT